GRGGRCAKLVLQRPCAARTGLLPVLKRREASMAKIVRLPATVDTRRTPAKQSGSRDFLARPRLIAALEEHKPALMLLLHAPAGYGKTVLLRQYQAYLTAAGADVCWLTLSEADRD